MSVFRADNPFMNIMTRIANLMILSFFWLVCSLPLVTLLPASAALYHTMIKVVHGNGNGVARDYFHAFAGSLRKGIPASLILVIAGGFLAWALYVGRQMMERSLAGTFYYVFGVVLAFLLIAGALHVIPALATFEGGVGMYLRLGLYFSSRNLFRTVLRLGLLGLVILMVDFYPIALLILPGVYMDLVSPGLKKLADRFMAENGMLDPGPDTGKPEGGTEAGEAGIAESRSGTEAPGMPAIDLDRQLSGTEEQPE